MITIDEYNKEYPLEIGDKVCVQNCDGGRWITIIALAKVKTLYSSKSFHQEFFGADLVSYNLEKKTYNDWSEWFRVNGEKQRIRKI